MSYQIEKLDKNRVKFVFDVEEQDWKDAIQAAYNKSKNKFHVEGFRKGHVPLKVILGMYGIEMFLDDAFDIIFPKYVRAALEAETDVKPVARPEIEVLALSDSTFKFAATFQEAPEVVLGAYTGLGIKKAGVRVTAQEIDAEIAKAQDKLVTWEPVEDRPAQDGDKTIIDYSGSVDGVKFEGGTAEMQELVLGSNTFIPGFEEQVVGMAIGENRDITVKFPEEYGEPSLAGKEAVFAITLHEIYIKNVPALDDEFVKDVSETADTVEEYKKEIKADIKARKEREAEYNFENEIVEKVVANATVDVPDVMIDEQADDMVYQFEYRLQYQGLKIEDYYKYTGSTRDDLKKQYWDEAKRHVLIRLVFEAIVKAENIEVTEEEIDKRIAELAEGAHQSVEDYKKNVSPDEINYISNQIVTDKLLDFLKANNGVK